MNQESTMIRNTLSFRAERDHGEEFGEVTFKISSRDPSASFAEHPAGDSLGLTADPSQLRGFQVQAFSCVPAFLSDI
jgi:hypothetical protein